MNQKIWQILEHRATQTAAVGVLGFTAGAMFGYWRTKSQYDRLEAELERAEQESEAAWEAAVERRVSEELEKRLPEIMGNLGYATETTVDDDDALEHLREDHPAGRVINKVRLHSVSINSDGSGPGEIVEVKPVIEQLAPDETNLHQTQKPNRRGVVTSVFGDGAGDEWDYKTEIENRDRTRPYAIHVDEFEGDEMSWDSQSTLTWYEKDRILTDSQDNPIFNPEGVVGLPLPFGHGSNDPNVVYIRNEQLQAEYEIIRDVGSYQETVLGEEMESAAAQEELKHSHNMKFRSD